MDHADPDLLVIGRFARLAGLSVGALRHYDELDVLRPAWVDPGSGYRSYRRDQLDVARTIVALRDLEVPLETIRAYLATDDPETQRRLLDDHRGRIEARTYRLQRVLHRLTQMTARGEATMTTAMPTELDPTTERAVAADLFNLVWTLLETADRSTEQDNAMVHAAHASRHHWSRVGDATHAATGEWQCSRVYAVLGRGEPSLHHARRCVEICDANDLGDFHRAAAFEAMARASAVAGDRAGAASWKARAIAALDDITDRDDRDIVESDIATLP